jgi:hypothetical protein
MPLRLCVSKLLKKLVYSALALMRSLDNQASFGYFLYNQIFLYEEVLARD